MREAAAAGQSYSSETQLSSLCVVKAHPELLGLLRVKGLEVRCCCGLDMVYLLNANGLEAFLLV